MRSNSEGMDYHVGPEIDVFRMMLFHDFLNVVIDLGLNGIHVFIEKSPVKNLLSWRLRKTLLGIPVESMLLVHSNIALAILTDYRSLTLRGADQRGISFSVVDVIGTA